MKNLFNIQYTKKFPFIKVSKKDFFAIFMIASAMGFLAFIYETLLDLLITNNLYDRGFLIGPFIPLYFFITFFVLIIKIMSKIKYEFLCFSIESDLILGYNNISN